MFCVFYENIGFFLVFLDILFYFCVSVCVSVHNKFSSQFPHKLLIADAWNFSTLFCGMPYGGIHFLYESNVNVLFICAAVRRVYNKFSSQFPQQLLIADAWNFSTLFVMACYMVGFIFSSPELKAQVSFSDRLLSGVRLSVCKHLHFWLLLENRWTNFNQTWHKSSLGEGNSSLFKGRR
jgi:hypothetical protein